LSITPPLVDVPMHTARYHVALEIGNSPLLQQWFDFQWVLVGNLGADALVVPLTPLLGLENAVWLIVVAISLLYVQGVFQVSRAAFGKPADTWAFAVPILYGY